MGTDFGDCLNGIAGQLFSHNGSPTFFSHVGSILFLLDQLGIFNIFLAQAMIPIGGVPGGLATYEFQNTLPFLF